jgi:adenylate kinase
MNILFIGPPGSGKGTQSKLLHDQFGLVHLSTGDMFREAIAKQTAVGQKAKAFMDRGEYVPDSVVIDLIRDRLSAPDCKNGFILDGFPRTEPQARALDELLGTMGLRLDAIFQFEIGKELLVERLSARRVCRKCNRIVSVDQIRAGDQACASGATVCDFYQRSDDAPEVVGKRIEVYQNQTAPILGYYAAKPGFLRIDADQSPDAVFSLLERALAGRGTA